jgi:hypothetical protein
MLVRKPGTKHAAPLADRCVFAGSVIVGCLRPEVLRHILVSSRIHGRSIPELSMAFRGDHAVRTDHAGFAGLLPIAAEKESSAFTCEIFEMGSGSISIDRSSFGLDLKILLHTSPAAITGSGAK